MNNNIHSETKPTFLVFSHMSKSRADFTSLWEVRTFLQLKMKQKNLKL